MAYRAPSSDYQFIFDKVVSLAPLGETEMFSDATPDMVSAILTEAAKLAAPLPALSMAAWACRNRSPMRSTR
jgi:hypothetical protein